VDLLLAKKEGLLMEMIPKEINVIEMEEYGEMFLLTGKNAMKTIFNNFVKKKPLTFFEILPYFLKIILKPSKKAITATQLWVHLMKKYFKPFEKEYDVAVAYWGDRTVAYMCDKISAAKKIAWLHFDYNNPPGNNVFYEEYFPKCDKIVTVSQSVDQALKENLPSVAEKCVVMANIIDPKYIWDLALRGETFPDAYFKGTRLLSMIRLSQQKGIDMIPSVLAKLKSDGYDVRWYIIGEGEDKPLLIEEAFRNEVADIMILLGTTTNPYSYLRDCDIYVQPSRYEGKPVVVEEAKIMYKLIVATNYLSAPEQLDNGRFGTLTEISVEGLYNGIKKLLDDETLCDNFTLTLSKENFDNTEEISKFYEM